MTTAIKVYLSFIVSIALSLIGLMFYLEPKMIIPSIVGVIIFTLIIYTFYKVIDKKSESEQRSIAKRNAKIGYVLFFVLTTVFFIAAAKHHNTPVIEFVRLWFGF